MLCVLDGKICLIHLATLLMAMLYSISIKHLCTNKCISLDHGVYTKWTHPYTQSVYIHIYKTYTLVPTTCTHQCTHKVYISIYTKYTLHICTHTEYTSLHTKCTLSAYYTLTFLIKMFLNILSFSLPLGRLFS